MEKELTNYSHEQIEELEKSRVISDADLLKGGAKYKIDPETGQEVLKPTDSQVEHIERKRAEEENRERLNKEMDEYRKFVDEKVVPAVIYFANEGGGKGTIFNFGNTECRIDLIRPDKKVIGASERDILLTTTDYSMSGTGDLQINLTGSLNPAIWIRREVIRFRKEANSRVIKKYGVTMAFNLGKLGESLENIINFDVKTGEEVWKGYDDKIEDSLSDKFKQMKYSIHDREYDIHAGLDPRDELEKRIFSGLVDFYEEERQRKERKE